MNIKSIKEKFYKKIRQSFFIEHLYNKIDNLNTLQIDQYLQTNLYNNLKYQNEKKLNKFEFQAFSQFGEDGIIEEIFNRIGTTNKYFVEFGVENGFETNTTYLLYKDWSGLWIDGDYENVKQINIFFKNSILNNKLKAVTNFITAENIESIFEKANVPKEFDLLSIDIDRNDYYIFEAIKNYNPRVVIIEYNAVFKPGCNFIVNYDANLVWDKTSNFGASIDSINKLANSKGYSLVTCNFAGLNAFFVRNDLLANKFDEPFTTQNHYQPPRYFLYKKDGHPRKISL